MFPVDMLVFVVQPCAIFAIFEQHLHLVWKHLKQPILVEIGILISGFLWVLNLLGARTFLRILSCLKVSLGLFGILDLRYGWFVNMDQCLFRTCEIAEN